MDRWRGDNRAKRVKNGQLGDRNSRCGGHPRPLTPQAIYAGQIWILDPTEKAAAAALVAFGYLVGECVLLCALTLVPLPKSPRIRPQTVASAQGLDCVLRSMPHVPLDHSEAQARHARSRMVEALRTCFLGSKALAVFRGCVVEKGPPK